MPNERIGRWDELSMPERSECRVAVVANPRPEDLRQLPNLQWVQSVWAGVEKLVAALGPTQLNIVRLVDPQLAETMAEAVLAWTLFLHRDMPVYYRQQQLAQWQAQEYVKPQARTVGLLGLGALGAAAARRLIAANFNVCGWSRSRKSIAQVECFAGDDELIPMLAKSDILVCLLPLTPATTGLIGARELGALPQNAQLINFARGNIIDDAALRLALDSGALKYAVLDVFSTEPLPPDEWHWRHPSVAVLPHCSAPTDMETASAIVAENIRLWRENGQVPVAVDIGRGY